MFRQDIEEFLAEIESHCYQHSIVTFLKSDGEVSIYDLELFGNIFLYNRHPKNRKKFISELLNYSTPVGSVVLRSFTAEIDQLTKFPVKELRGYVLRGYEHYLAFEKLPPETMFACQNTDAETGGPLPLEQSVKYC